MYFVRPRIAGLVLSAVVVLSTSMRPAAVKAEPQPAANVAPRAEAAELPQIEARRQALFKRMMADPGNLDIAFEYAALSSQAGDLEGAIATLERMLIFAPGLPRLQLELGVLYFRLGAYESALTYFNGALAGPNVPIEVREKVQPNLVAIEARSAIDTFHGAVMVGGRYQSNANGGPDSRIVNLNGLDFLLNDAAMGDPDSNAFISGNFLYSHDLGTQGDHFDVNLLAYGALYAEQHEVNTALAELTFGPVFNLERYDIENASLGFYGILGGVALESDPYLLSGGVGTSFTKALDPLTQVQLQAEHRRENFDDSNRRPTASDRTGDRVRLAGRIQHQVTSQLTLFASFDGERRNADRSYLSDWEIGGAVGGSFVFRSPIPSQALPWTVSLSAGFLNRSFDDPDPIINISEAEVDREGFVQGILTIPVRETVSLQAVVGYRDVRSNYDIHAFDDFSASLGIMKSF